MNVLSEDFTIALRAYPEPPDQPQGRTVKAPKRDIGPSAWVLVFDTETTTDHAQALRVGAYELLKADELKECGLFYEPEALTRRELKLLTAHARSHKRRLLTREQFVEEVVLRRAYRYGATLVTFNALFDFSRLAIAHGTSRGGQYGGFALTLSPHRWWPRLQVRHLTNRAALVGFTVPAGQLQTRSARNNGYRRPAARRGYFVDVRTLAGALFGRSFTLADLAEFLGLAQGKLQTDEHGKALSSAYLDYLLRDVAVTREAFQVLRELYRSFGLRKTRLDRIYSEASLAKACFKEMGIPSWRELASEFPGELLGPLMSSQYGGRSEVHLHHEVVPVQLCDFRACYPAVSCLLRTFDFLRAGEVTTADATEGVRAFVEEFEPEELRYPGFWRSLCVLVEIVPDEDRLPVRAPYSGAASPQFTTALNYLTSEVPLWYALPDVLVSKLSTGRTPQILRAVSLYAGSDAAGASRDPPHGPAGVSHRSWLRRFLRAARRATRTGPLPGTGRRAGRRRGSDPALSRQRASPQEHGQRGLLRHTPGGTRGRTRKSPVGRLLRPPRGASRGAPAHKRATGHLLQPADSDPGDRGRAPAADFGQVTSQARRYRLGLL